ncbi:YfjI family protein [Yersinia intermedia]|uniref:YfjI family protein n=1 Tax=Yersinia intermedia TaxID=631 RepID=UPI0022FEC698|nr:YfjI family protein [Yersinia intermedia]MDA5510811.1 YfjI family protein [Yersinia intermedia]
MNLPPQIYNQAQVTGTHQLAYTVNEYPVLYFPSVLKNVIRELHDATQIPIELIGNVVLAAASLACQSLVEVIQPHTNMPEPCSLYLLTVAESGEGKTTINKQVMKPFYDFASEMKQEYEVRLSGFKREYKIWKVRQQALDSNLRQAIKHGYPGEIEELEIENHAQNEPIKPVRPNFIYEDTSLKALIEGLSEHPEAGFISDEAITFFKSHLKNNPGLLNKAWDGEVYDFRRADGEKYEVKPCLTFSLMVQPGIFRDYLNKHGDSGRSSGFLSRFLYSWGNSNLGYRAGNAVCDNTKHDLNIFYDKVASLLSDKKKRFYEGNVEIKTLVLSEQAMALWRNSRAVTEGKMAPGHEWEHIRDVASKAGANTLRMAAIFQYLTDDSSDTIQPDIMEKTQGIMKWYMNQASQLFYPMSERYQFEHNVRELYSWIKNRFIQNNGFAFPVNDLEKYGPNRLRRINKLTPVLSQLIHQGCFCVIRMRYNGALYMSYTLQNGSYALPPIKPGVTTEFVPVSSAGNTVGRPVPVDFSGL